MMSAYKAFLAFRAVRDISVNEELLWRYLAGTRVGDASALGVGKEHEDMPPRC